MKFKRLVSSVLSSALVLGLLGCSSSGSKTSSSDAQSDTKNSQSVELQFWDMVWGPPEYIDTAKQLVDQFNQEHPNIKVKYQSTPWNNWYQTFSTAIASGTAPDISTGAGYQAFQFSESDAILPIDDVIEDLKKEGKLNDFTPNSVEAMKYNGHTLALPWQIDTRVLYYRKDLFEKAGVQPPKNFQELRDVAKKLTHDGTYGMVIPGDSPNPLFSLFLNNGGGMFTKDKKVDVMNERNVETAKWVSDMAKDGSLNPAGSGYTNDDAIKSFFQGKSALLIDSPGLIDRADAELKDKIGIVEPIEGFHGDKGAIAWYNNIMLYRQTKHPKEAKEFLKWWSENNKDLWTKGHVSALPVRTSFTKDPYFANDPNRKLLIDKYLPIGKTTGFSSPSVFPQLNEIEGDGSAQTLLQETLVGKDPEKSMKNFEAAVKKIMK